MKVRVSRMKQVEMRGASSVSFTKRRDKTKALTDLKNPLNLKHFYSKIGIIFLRQFHFSQKAFWLQID